MKVAIIDAQDNLQRARLLYMRMTIVIMAVEAVKSQDAVMERLFGERDPGMVIVCGDGTDRHALRGMALPPLAALQQRGRTLDYNLAAVQKLPKPGRRLDSYGLANYHRNRGFRPGRRG